jgi:hypothetical protein
MFGRPLLVLPLSLALGFSIPDLCLAQAAPGRAGGSLLWLARPVGKLDVGKDVRGALSASDYLTPQDVYLDVYELAGQAGQSLTIELASQDFDAVLFAVGEGLAETLTDDDGGQRCDARLEVRFLETGTYRIAASTTMARTTGVYTIRASTNPAAITNDIPCGGTDPAVYDALRPAGQVAIGGTATGALGADDTLVEGDKYAEVWTLTGEAGQTVNVRLEAEGFDTFLVVTGPGLGTPLTDDDSGGELNSELEVTFPQSGVYRVVVTSAGARATGTFRLSVTR